MITRDELWIGADVVLNNGQFAEVLDESDEPNRVIVLTEDKEQLELHVGQPMTVSGENLWIEDLHQWKIAA